MCKKLPGRQGEQDKGVSTGTGGPVCLSSVAPGAQLQREEKGRAG